MRRYFFAAAWVIIGMVMSGCPTNGGPHSLTISPEEIALKIGESASLTANSSVRGDVFTWSSDKAEIVTISAEGRITALALGSVQVRVASQRTSLIATAKVTVIEDVPPAVSLGQPSTADTRQGPITFDVAYAGVTTISLESADVTINATGTVAAAVDEIVPTGDFTRSIAINPISGDGTFTIAIAAGTAADAEGNEAPASSPSAVVNVDNTAPTVDISAPSAANTSTGPIDYLVNYGGADDITLTKADVLVNGTGTVAATLADVAATGESERTVSFSSINGEGTLGISIAAATAADRAGNTAEAAGPSEEVTVDNTPPTVTIGAPAPAATNDGPLSFRITYDGASEITLTQTDIILNGSSGVVSVLDEIEVTSETVRTVRFSTVAGDGTLGISLAAGTATDAAGNSAPAAGPSATATIDNTAPTVTIGAPTPNNTGTGPVTFPVTYEGADDITLSAAAITLNRTGTSNAQVTAITGAEGGPYHITLGSVIGNGTLGISLAANTATDNAGNPAPQAGPSASIQVENDGPTLLIGPPSSANTFEENVSYTITYADATSITLAPADITLNSEDGLTAAIAVTGEGTTQRTVTLSAFSGLGQATITIAPGTAQNDSAEQAPAAGPSAPFSVNPTLQPGSGFTAPTPQPDPIGDPGAPGIDAKAIARWDVVPYQTFDGYFEIGVVAFHINDIDRIEFSVEGGPWTAVKEMTHNPRTDVVEYWVGLDARDFEDGPIEVRAVAYPKVGIPRVLQGDDVTVANGEYSTHLFTNADGSFVPEQLFVSLTGDDANPGTRTEPVGTIGKALDLIKANAQEGFDIVLLDAGLYIGPDRGAGSQRIGNERWIHIYPDEGLNAAQVVISMPNVATLRPGAGRVHWERVTFNFGKIRQYYGLNGLIWFDRTVWYDEYGPANEHTSNVRGTYYVTDSTASDIQYAFTNAMIVRGCTASRIGGDVFQNSKYVLNCRVTSTVGEVSDHHTDVYQMWGPADNTIVYCVDARELSSTQALFLEPTNLSALGSARNTLSNSAFVNLNLRNRPVFRDGLNWGGPPNSQMMSSFSHVLFRDIQLPEQRFLIRQFDETESNQWLEAKDVLFQRMGFHPLTWEGFSNENNWPQGVRFESCYAAEAIAVEP